MRAQNLRVEEGQNYSSKRRRKRVEVCECTLLAKSKEQSPSGGATCRSPSQELPFMGLEGS
jgi:hypothetical protein